LKRSAAKHAPVFDDEEFVARYASKHIGMARRFAKEYARKLREKGFSSGRILDAGCGFGETLIRLATKFPQAECMGIDLSEPLLEIAGRNCDKAGAAARVEFKKADVQEIPFPDNHFDVLLNINMAHLVTDPIKMFNEMERVLRPEGNLFVVDIRRSWIGYLEKEFRAAMTVEEAMQLLERANIREGQLTSGFLWWRYEA